MCTPKQKPCKKWRSSSVWTTMQWADERMSALVFEIESFLSDACFLLRSQRRSLNTDTAEQYSRISAFVFCVFAALPRINGPAASYVFQKGVLVDMATESMKRFCYTCTVHLFHHGTNKSSVICYLIVIGACHSSLISTAGSTA